MSCPYKDISGRQGVGNTVGSWQWCKLSRQWCWAGKEKKNLYIGIRICGKNHTFTYILRIVVVVVVGVVVEVVVVIVITCNNS